MPKTTMSTAPKQSKESTIHSLSVEEINAVSGAGSKACCTGVHYPAVTLHIS